MNYLNWIACSIGLLLMVLPTCSAAQECLLYSVRTDGTGLKIEVQAGIDRGLQVYGSPDVSPNGERLIFDAYSQGNLARQAKILVIDIAGDAKGQIFDYDCGNCPVWSPDGTHIAFEVCAGNPLNLDAGVWLMDSDGNNAERLSEGEQPRWFPNGNFVISTILGGGVRFIKVDLRTKETTPFLDQFRHEEPVRFSKDGTQVLAHVQRNGKGKLISMAVSGAEDSIVELAEEPVSFPVFSPDGKSIAFSSSNPRDGKHIQVIAADGKGKPKKLTFAPQAAKEDLCWHPDGTRILFISRQRLKVEKNE